MPFSSSNRQVIIRMTQEDRQSINRMIQHKRDEFENVIKKGIVSMLNAHVERKKISKERSEYLNVLTRRNHQKKEQMTMLADAAQHATASAPMGIGAASNVAIATASGLGSVAMDNAESRRQEIEAQEQFRSAQMLHYITDKDYEAIAQAVASTLGYRFQFLLFRLAAGENGYIKFADFLVSSIKTHAIERLREHKSQVVQALIDAATPPSTDAISYRDWPQVSIRKFKFQHRFASHKTLELDDQANQIIARCGPAVRALLGAHRSYFDTKKGKIKHYKPYTIIGALNHAPILNSEAGVFKGLETPHRKREILDGTMKYPMLLLACGETTAHLGVNFATKATGQFLESAHVVALLRLVPTFFSHQAISQNAMNDPVEKSLPKINNEDLRYPSERFECPWTDIREHAWQERLEFLYTIDDSEIKEEDVFSTKEDGILKMMEDASNIFDAQEAKKNLLSVVHNALLAEINVNAADIKISERRKKQLEAAIASKYVALATSELMTCIVQCNALDDTYFDLAVEGIEAANSAFNAARNLPMHETSKYHQVVEASNKAIQSAEKIFQLHYLYRDVFQIVLTSLQKSSGFTAGDKWHNKEAALQASRMKDIKARVNEDVHDSSRLVSLSRVMTEYLQQENEALEQATALASFYIAADQARAALDHIESPYDSAMVVKIIQLHALETEKNRDYIRLALSVDSCDVVDDQLDEDRLHEDGWHEDIKVHALAAADDACTEALTALQNTTQFIETLGIWQRNISLDSRGEAQLRSYIDDAVTAKNKSIALIRRIKYGRPDQLSPDMALEVNIFLARAKANTERGLLRFVAHQQAAARITKTGKSKTPAALQIEETLAQFELNVRQLNLAIKVDRARQATEAHDSVMQASTRTFATVSFQSLEQQARKVQQDRLDVERAITHDFEITDYSKNKAQWAVTEGEQAAQEMGEMKEKLRVLQQYCTLEEDSIDSLSLLDSKSESTSTPTNVKQLANLDVLLNLMRSSEESPHQYEAGEEERVSDELCQLIASCTNMSTVVDIADVAIRTKILASIAYLKEELSSGAKGLSAHWDTWLVAQVAEWVMQTIEEMAIGVSQLLDQARRELNLIKQISNDESSALKIARESALQAIKKAYMDIGYAKERQRELERNPRGLERVQWALVQSTLAWTARLNYAEYKWLEGKRASKQVGTSLVDYKSPMIRSHLFLFVYSRHMLDNKKEDIRRLNQASLLLRQCQKQLYHLGQADEKARPKKLHGIEKRHDWLDKLVSKKLEQAEFEKNDIESFRSSILLQGLRIYFNEWKKKTYDINTQDVRTLALKAAATRRQQLMTDHTPSDKGRDDEEKASEQDIKFARAGSANFSHKKESTKHTLSEQVLKCKDDAENNTIDDIEVMIESLKDRLTGLNASSSTQSSGLHESSFVDLQRDLSMLGTQRLNSPSPPKLGEVSSLGLFAQAKPNTRASATDAPSSGVLIQVL